MMYSNHKAMHSTVIARLNHRSMREWLISLQTPVIISISQADVDGGVSSLVAFSRHKATQSVEHFTFLVIHNVNGSLLVCISPEFTCGNSCDHLCQC